MENIGWTLYLCNLINGLGIFCGITGALSLLAFVIYALNNTLKDLRVKFKYMIPGAILLLVCCITPTKSTCYLIFGVTETVKYISNNDELKKLPDNAVKALNYWLEEQVKEDKEE